MAKPGYKKVVPPKPVVKKQVYVIESDGSVLENIGDRSYRYVKSNTKEGDVLNLKEDQKLPKGRWIDADQVNYKYFGE